MYKSWLINFIIVLYWVPLISGTVAPCESQSVQELIKTSPVILKALGARIFADVGSVQLPEDEDNATTTSATKTKLSSSSTLITLTPTTLYKGASLLKVAQTLDGGEYYHYEGQINATIEQLGCFENGEENILDILPTELIAFGKLDSDQPDILRVNINGLHKWSSLFEGRIWKHLGWDDWSDFTPCSIVCGKGVQQRFRRCLLDNPNAGRGEGIDPPVEYYHPAAPGHKLTTTKDQSNNRNHKKYAMPSSRMMKKRRKKKGKVLSTQSCEGYNIEQRTCNMFECRDDITDLLKFYKKSFNDDSTQIQPQTTLEAMTVGSTTNPSTFQTTSGGMLLLRGLENLMNFTIMTTIRAKTKSQSTIFSLRNATHNLYLDQSHDGLKLFQERNDVTEMLPIKLDLYDNRWHQIAISVHNGDFITIYVDCIWTDSFIVSKGLFTLPDSADAEVGRSFTGEFQQLIIMPGNHEKLQCSSARTSINEVKRYIIDTFIEDDSN